MSGNGSMVLKAGPWFPYLRLNKDDPGRPPRGHRPRVIKSAGFKQMIQQAPINVSAASAAGESAGPAVGEHDR